MRDYLAALKQVPPAVERWMMEPVDSRPLGLFRLWFGFLCLVNLVLLWPDMLMWFGNDGVLPPDVHRRMTSGFRISFYTFTGYSDHVILMMRLFGFLGGLGLLTGIFPRSSAFLTWMTASSIAWRNADILNSGDNLIRIGSFFLIFARSGESFNLLNLVQAWRGRPDSPHRGKIPAWPQRILQLQLCIVYFVAGVWKAKGDPWLDGSAVGTVLQLGEFQRFPIPDFVMTPFASSVLTFFTLGFELAFPFLVWVPRLLVPVLVTGILLHAGLEWMMNVQLFQWVITSYYLLFLRFKKNQFDKESIKTDA